MAAEFSAAYVPDGTSSRRQSNGGALEEGKDTVVSFVIKDTTKIGQQIEGKGKGPEDDWWVAQMWNWCQKQASQTGISKYISQYTVGCNYLSM